MNLDLSNLKETGSSKSIKKQIKLPDFEYHNQKIVVPYLFDIDLNVYNTEDSYIITGLLSGVLILLCSRCLDKFDYKVKLDLDENLLKSSIKDPKKIDLSEIFIKNIILSLPMKYLCLSECKGLCTVCGQNLNISECDCDTRMIDPRLAKLKEFYNDNEE